ncbi:hypothetical protein DTO021D3_8147 [Paecilomyces variotii]|nr:hypothetical protein DTO032I3_4701 [Paecilomyces variotii]KAJ9225109.1 hypothetical protein DTO169C6_2450 [Paecilomyces variotii]KAJ9249948.1 hypothetical protein DTO195F2_8318 [Paecilomyces variotii]KAJ9274976.1 hypothetical protein DTO021D3_8147 [Paecilomyces variotii]KAJ9291524.1 hypothetical protein DTO021C3_881 [Paecilomyces variotii]
MPRSPKVLSSRYTSLTVQTGCTKLPALDSLSPPGWAQLSFTSSGLRSVPLLSSTPLSPSSVLIGALPLRERKRPEYHRSCGAALRTTRLRMSIERIFFKTYAG